MKVIRFYYCCFPLSHFFSVFIVLREYHIITNDNIRCDIKLDLDFHDQNDIGIPFFSPDKKMKSFPVNSA